MQKVGEVGAGSFPSINLQAGDGIMSIGERERRCACPWGDGVATGRGPWLLAPQTLTWRAVPGGPEASEASWPERCETDVLRQGFPPTL